MEFKAPRYPRGREFYYDFAYSSEVRNSRVLNGEYEVGELEELLELKEKRMNLLEDELNLLVLPAEKLAKQTAFNKGTKYVEPDREREKRVTLEAKIDVCKLEMAKIEEAIEEAEEEKERHDKQPCLPRGPEGNNSVRGSTGSGYVDGQWAEHVGNAGLVIVDERSMYRGMLVIDYIEHIAKPWIRASYAYKDKVRKEGKDLEVNHGPGRGSRHVPWPEWPATVKNHLSNGQANGQTSTSKKPKILRTK